MENERAYRTRSDQHDFGLDLFRPIGKSDLLVNLEAVSIRSHRSSTTRTWETEDFQVAEEPSSVIRDEKGIQTPFRLQARASLTRKWSRRNSMQLRYTGRNLRSVTEEKRWDTMTDEKVSEHSFVSSRSDGEHRLQATLWLWDPSRSNRWAFNADAGGYSRKYGGEADTPFTSGGRHLDYRQQVAFLRSGWTGKALDNALMITLGIRGEYVHTAGQWTSSSLITPLQRSESNILPSLDVLYSRRRFSFGAGAQWRVRRPYLEMLHPYTDYPDAGPVAGLTGRLSRRIGPGGLPAGNIPFYFLPLRRT